MKKSWLYSAIAGFALLATACTNNAGPDNTTGNNNGTAGTQSYAGNFNYGANGYGTGGNAANRYGTYGYDTNGYGAAGYGNRNFVGNYAGWGTNANTTGSRAGAPGVNGYAAGTTGTHFGWNTPGTNQAGNPGVGADNTAFGNDRTDGYYGMASNNNGFRGMRDFNIFGDGNGNRNNTYYGPLSVYRNRGMGTLGANNVSNIGYANISSSNLRSNAVNQVYVDRDALARAVGNVTASVPGVRAATVLVTDEEIFVGLNSRGTNTQDAKSKARMNAMSVSPRYYRVYVTDNQQMIAEMSRIASRTSNVNANTTQDQRHIDSLIRSFGGQVDGEENGNGSRAQRTGGTGAGTTGTTGSTTNNMGTTSR